MQLTCICIIYEGEKKTPQFATKTTKQLTKRNIHSSTDPSSCLSTHVLFFYIYFKYSPIKKKSGVILQIHTLVSLLLDISHKNHEKS